MPTPSDSTYHGKQGGLYQAANVLKTGLLTAASFNPLCVLSEAISGQNAGGDRVSKVQRGLDVLMLAAGPLVKLGSRALRSVTRASVVGETGGFSSFHALKRYLGNPGEKRVWHHVVEACRADRFGAEAVHNVANVYPVTERINTAVNAVMSSIRPDLTGGSALTVRQWLRHQPLKAHREFGWWLLKQVMGGILP